MTSPGTLTAARQQLLNRLRHGEVPAPKRTFQAQVFRPQGAQVPLSPGQEQVWLHAQMAGDAPIYNESVTIHKRGSLDAAILERCLDEIARRHEIWRSGFHTSDGKVVQQIEPAAHVPVRFVDLSCLKDQEREAEAVRMATEDVRTPFDLSLAPLVRVRLVRLSPDYHRIYLTMHHLIFDGVSIYRVMIKELVSLYSAYSAGRPSPLPELSVQYRDYAGWKRHLLDGGGHAAELKYWREALAGELPALELPVDRPLPAKPTWQGGMETCVISQEALDQLAELGRSEGVTRYMLLLAVFQILLYRYSGQEEIIVGGTLNTRTRPEFESLIGYFLNTVVLRGQLQAKQSFREYLASVKGTVLGALANSEIPFDAIVREIVPKRDSTQLFQVLFSMRPPFNDTTDGWDITSMEVHNGASSFDLFAEFSELPHGLVGRFVYKRDLFERQTIQRLVANFQVLLRELLAHPDEAISKANLLTEQERHTLLFDWNATQREFPKQRVHERFEAQVKANPEHTALVFDRRHMTYAELNSQSNRLAGYLRTQGAGSGALVGLCLERSFDMVVALLAVLKAGAAYVPYDPDLPAVRLKAMLGDSQPCCVLTQRKFKPLFVDYPGHAIALDAVSEEIASQSDANLQIEVRPEEAIYAIYTSGSTGLPKAAVNTHEAVANRLFWMQSEYRLEAGDRVLQKTPYTFDVSVWEFFWPLMAGATLVIAAPGGHKDPAYLANLIGREAVTTIHFVPSMLREFLDAADLDRCGSLERVFASGEALPLDLSRRFYERLDAELHNLYGPTEAAVDVTYWDCSREAQCTAVPIGRPISNVRTYILDQHLAPVPIGVAGELHIGGVALARGYLNRPELTAERFIPDPFGENPQGRLYKTGDRARYLADGNIEYLGRLDNQVKLHGLRIELGEIEAALLESGQVKAAAVVLNLDRNGDQCLVGYLVPQTPPVDLPALRSHLSLRLPEYMIPSSFVTLGSLPKTASGKLDRKALPAPENCPDEQRPFVPPADQIEERLVALWEDVLGVHPVSVDDNYFALGGHSLLALRLFSQINLSFQVELPLATLFHAPTVGSMAALIRDSAVQRTASPLVPIQPKGAKRPIFCVGPLNGEVIMFRPLALELGLDQPLYGLQPFDLPGKPSTVEELASSYIQEMRKWGEPQPACVMGYSFGGLVAFEIALQLVRDGAEPPTIVLIDANYLSACKAREAWSHRMRRYQHHLHRIVHGAAGFDYLAGLLQRRSLSMIQKLSHAVNVGLPKAMGQTARLQLYAAENYHAKRYRGPVYLVKAESRPEFFDKPDLGWGDIVSDLRVRTIPGDHSTIMTGMNVKLMARRLKTILENAPEAFETAPEVMV